MNPYIITRHLHKVNYLKPQASQIDIRDIGHSLSRICRYNGHTIQPYYVAQHLCICYDVALQQHKRAAFGHDFAEYAACDIPSPLKALLPQYVEIEGRLEQVVARKYRLTYPWPAAVKEIDMRVLVTEIRDLTHRKDWKDYPVQPYDFTIVSWDSAKCYREFMRRARALGLTTGRAT